MTNIKKEYLALDKNLSKACGWLQCCEDEMRDLINSSDDEELVGLLLDLEDELSRYSEIDNLREKIRRHLKCE